MNNHLARFKVLYIQLAVAIAVSIAGELEPLAGLTKEQLHAITWVNWAILVLSIVGVAGNTLVASLQPPPQAAPPKAAPGVAAQP